MEMKLDKKQLWAIFLFEFKMGHKAAETTHNINSVFGPETANKYCSAICFCKGDKSLADEGLTGQPTEVDSDQLGGNSGADPLTTKWGAAEELLWSKLERWKNSLSGCLVNWLKI